MHRTVPKDAESTTFAALDLKNGLCYTDETWAILLGTPTKASNSLTEVCTYLSAVKAAESDLQYGGEGQ